MDTLAEGWRYFTKEDIGLLRIYHTKPYEMKDITTLPFTKIDFYKGLMMYTDTLHPEYKLLRRKLIAMWCNDYMTLEEMKRI